MEESIKLTLTGATYGEVARKCAEFASRFVREEQLGAAQEQPRLPLETGPIPPVAKREDLEPPAHRAAEVLVRKGGAAALRALLDELKVQDLPGLPTDLLSEFTRRAHKLAT